LQSASPEQRQSLPRASQWPDPLKAPVVAENVAAQQGAALLQSLACWQTCSQLPASVSGSITQSDPDEQHTVFGPPEDAPHDLSWGQQALPMQEPESAQQVPAQSAWGQPPVLEPPPEPPAVPPVAAPVEPPAEVPALVLVPPEEVVAPVLVAAVVPPLVPVGVPFVDELQPAPTTTANPNAKQPVTVRRIKP
jgi:hypothetical protein